MQGCQHILNTQHLSRLPSLPHRLQSKAFRTSFWGYDQNSWAFAMLFEASALLVRSIRWLWRTTHGIPRMLLYVPFNQMNKRRDIGFSSSTNRLMVWSKFWLNPSNPEISQQACLVWFKRASFTAICCWGLCGCIWSRWAWGMNYQHVYLGFLNPRWPWMVAVRQPEPKNLFWGIE